jgi:hypothetical protein
MADYFSKLIGYYKRRGFSMTLDRIAEYIRHENPVRIMIIKSIQRKKLFTDYSAKAKRLIIFLTPDRDIISGGILSINSIYNETCRLKPVLDAEVVMCTVPGNFPLLKYTKFENQNYLFTLPGVLAHFQTCERLLIHIPEDYVENFVKYCSTDGSLQETAITSFQFNILLQNIDLAPSKESIKELQRWGAVTCTTAHEAYTNLETQERLGCPIHKLSTYVSPEQYLMKSYREKENLMIVSPDDHELKSTVFSIISKAFPEVRLQVIKNLTYEQFKEAISKAKWALTFGEGLDGYFIEPIFSGCIGFAVYNERFFTEVFRSFRTVYPSYQSLMNSICLDMAEFDNEKSFTEYQREQYESCAKFYNYKEYQYNISSFYLKYFSSANPIQKTGMSGNNRWNFVGDRLCY